MRDECAVRSRSGPAKLGRVCTTIMGKTSEEMAKKAALAFRLGTDMVEFRVDYAQEPVAKLANGIAAYSDRSIITVRKKEEGGRFTGNEEERLAAISELAGLGELYLDVELNTARENPQWFSSLPRTAQKIVSWHDFGGTPSLSVLEKTRAAAAKIGEVAKVVTTSRSEQDNLRVMKLYGKEPQGLVAFCMGEVGTATRIESLRLGSPVVYASLPDEPAAPGQLSVWTLAGMKHLWEAE